MCPFEPFLLAEACPPEALARGARGGLLGRGCAGRRRSPTAPLARSPFTLALFIFRSAQPLRGSLAAQRGSLVLTGIGGWPHRRPARSESERPPRRRGPARSALPLQFALRARSCPSAILAGSSRQRLPLRRVAALSAAVARPGRASAPPLVCCACPTGGTTRRSAICSHPDRKSRQLMRSSFFLCAEISSSRALGAGHAREKQPRNSGRGASSARDTGGARTAAQGGLRVRARKLCSAGIQRSGE